MIHGFLRVCTLSPSLRVADCPYNAKMTVEAMRQAAADGAQLAVFPELGLTGYTCSDLFLQQPLQRAAEEALRTVLETSETLALVAAAGQCGRQALQLRGHRLPQAAARPRSENLHSELRRIL